MPSYSVSRPMYNRSGALSASMRFARLCALACLALPAFAEGVTIVLDFQGPRSEPAIAEMKREFTGIMKDSPVTFNFKSRAQVTQDAPVDLLVVRFTGTCVFEPAGF